MPFHPMQHPPALLTDCIKKGFPHKESLRVSTVSAPLPIARGLSGRAKQAVLLAWNPRAAASSQGIFLSDRVGLLRAALLFLTVAGPLRRWTEFPIKPRGAPVSLLCSFIQIGIILFYNSSFVNHISVEKSSQFLKADGKGRIYLTKSAACSKISIEKGHCRWAAAPYAIGEIPRLRFGAKGGVFSFIFLLTESVWYIL